MNKKNFRIIGVQIILLGLVLSVFESLIDNSELVIGSGIILITISFFVKK